MLAEIVVVGLVSYRLWRLLAIDGILNRPREWVLGASVGRHEFLACPWCSGWWVTGLITLIAWQTGLTSDPLWVWPAASVVCGWLGEQL